MAADTDLVASKAAALRLAQQMGCSGAHQHPDGKWMPCATMEEYEELVKKDKKNTVRVVEQRRRYRKSKGKNKRDWEPLTERGVTSIDTIDGGGLVGGRGGSIKGIAPWAPDDEDPDVFTTPRLARRRSRQLGCIGISRRVSRNGNIVWTPCSNMTDYAKRTGSTAFGRLHQRRQAQRRLERAVSREVRRQLRRKKSLMEELYEGKALGRKLNRARVAATTPFNPDARDADMDMIVQEGTPWERPARPRVPGLASARTGRRRAERWADRLQRRRDLRTERRDRRAFEKDMEKMPPAPITDEDIDLMYEYYAFEESVGLKSTRGFKLTPEEETNLSQAEKAAKYRKASLDAVGEEHRGKAVQKVHWVFGAPGSGKTVRTNRGELGVPNTSEAVHTNPDDYKEFHDLWNYGDGSFEAHQFSRLESEETLRTALNEGMDVVVQGTGKDGRLLGDTIYDGGDYRNGRRGDRVSVMHFLHVPDLERSRRISDRRTGQRRRYGAEPRDASQIRDQVVKYIEEGRVDEAHIYDNGGSIDEAPSLIASFKDGNLVIYDEDKFDEIFDPKDSDGEQITHWGKLADLPQVSNTSRPDDPRRGKSYAERLRAEGENPGGFRKWDEERREKSIRERSKREAQKPAGYRGIHQAPTKSAEGGDTLDDLSSMLPLGPGEDNTHRIRFYGSGTSDPEYARANDEMLEALNAAEGDPDQIITVYRAVPEGRGHPDQTHRIIAGDWVTPSPTYAAIHGEGPMRGEYEITEMEVRAGDLVSEGNSLYEFGYDPEPPPPSGPEFEEGESLQNAYRRHLKAQEIQTDGEQAFEEQYGYELRSGDGDCYSASYRAATELAEKGVDADGDPVENIRVVVGSPVFPEIGERSGHAWVEYEVVKPPPPVMSSADQDKAKEQILELVEQMDLPPEQKQATIDSFTDAMSRANEANASMPARSKTMVRDYSNVKDIDPELLAEERPDMTRSSYYEAGELNEADISGRFTPAEYEETQVSLFGDEFYDGSATFLTREQVDQHLEDMGIEGLASKRSDDEDAEYEQWHQDAMDAFTNVFNEEELYQSNTDIEALVNALFSPPPGFFGDPKPISQKWIDAVQELVKERDPNFLEELAEVGRIRTTNQGFRRLTNSGLDSGVGDYGPGVVSNAYDSSRWREEGAPITLFHGGMVDLTGDVEYEVSRHDSGQWGPGIYTTSSPFPAIKGWANPWKRNAEGSYDTGPPGYLHTTRWKGENPPRILDVEEALPDEIIDDVVIPTIEKLRREIDKARKEGTIERFTSEDAEYMLDEITDSIVSMRDRNNDITGRDTLLPIQQWLQEWEMPTEDNPGWNENGFLTLDRISTIRKEINTAIREQGHDVIKSHEKGIRDMSRTDYLFLDPDMVEFVDVASTHSLGGFGNMGSLEMHRIVTGRAKERENRGEAA